MIHTFTLSLSRTIDRNDYSTKPMTVIRKIEPVINCTLSAIGLYFIFVIQHFCTAGCHCKPNVTCFPELVYALIPQKKPSIIMSSSTAADKHHQFKVMWLEPEKDYGKTSYVCGHQILGLNSTGALGKENAISVGQDVFVMWGRGKNSAWRARIKSVPSEGSGKLYQ